MRIGGIDSLQRPAYGCGKSGWHAAPARGSNPDLVELSCAWAWTRQRIEQVHAMVRDGVLPAPIEVARRVVEAALAA